MSDKVIMIIIIIFAEISRKFSAVRWFDKTEDCIFPRSFILRSNVQSFNILPSFNLTIYLAVFSQSIAIHNLFKPSSITFTESFLFMYPFRKYTPHCVYLRLMQLNVCHILTRIIKVFTHVPAIPARFFSICRLFLVAINNNHYIFWPVT